MTSINKVILIGRLGADPEVRRTQSGDPIVNMRVATSETWRDRNSGERKEKTEWHQVVLFNENHAKFAEQYASKGAMVYVEGQLQTRKWQDQSGQDRYSTEIVLQKFHGEFRLLDKPSEGRNEGRSEHRQDRGIQQQGGRYGAHDDLDDQIPFSPEWR